MTLSIRGLRHMPLALAASLVLCGIAQAAPLTVTVTGIENRGGTLYVGVQTKDQFMQDAGVAGDMIETPDQSTYTSTFDLAPGDYSVSVWHDENGDGVFNTDDFGAPLDGWSINKAEQLRARPQWDEVKITIGEDGTAVSLPMIYPAAK